MSRIFYNNKTRVFMCVNDHPGTLYLILSSLSLDRHNQENNQMNKNNDNSEFVVNIRYITVETCERFSKLSRVQIEEFSKEVSSVAHRVRFHALLEITKKRIVPIKRVKKVKNMPMMVPVKKVLIKNGLIEITACLHGHNLLSNLLYLLELVGANKSANSQQNGIIHKLLIVPDPNLTENFVGDVIQHRLNAFISTNNFNCPQMGTCPLAKLNDTNQEVDANNHENAARIELKFLRDHGCYTNNTLLEFIFDNKNQEDNKNKQEDSVSALVLKTHSGSKIAEEYLNKIRNKLVNNNFLVGLKRQNNTIQKLVAFKPYHTCEYYPCYIVRNIHPKIKIGDFNEYYQ